MKARSIAAIAVLAIALAACGGTQKVGSGNIKIGGKGRFEAVAPKAPSPTAKATRSAPATNTNTNTNTQKKDDVPSIRFDITLKGFDPYYIRVFAGGLVLVTNKDSQPRSVTADQGEFDSGMIQPGKTWTYRATTPGKFNFHDATRPYVVGILEVLAK